MKKVLLTGGSGFIGSHVLDYLQDDYEIYAPDRKHLDVRNQEQVVSLLKKETFDIILHFASPSPVRSSHLDSYEALLEDSIKIFMNFYAMRSCFGRMIYSGSGAEYDKRRDIRLIREEEIGKSLPTDSYGLSKYVINELSQNSDNIYNLRIFACYGPNEYSTKFITHAIDCCLRKQPITIQQDCWFDYLYVDDYARYVKYFMDHIPRHHDYNVCSGIRIRLSDIAEIVREQLNNKYETAVLAPGLNHEYTGSNDRIVKESRLKPIISIEAGIQKLIRWKEENQYET